MERTIGYNNTPLCLKITTIHGVWDWITDLIVPPFIAAYRKPVEQKLG